MAESWRVVHDLHDQADRARARGRAAGARPRAGRAGRARAGRRATSRRSLALTPSSAPAGRRSALRQGQVVDRAAAARLRARPDGVLGLPVEDPAGRARRRRGSDRSTSIRPCCRATAARSRSRGRCAPATPTGASPGIAWTPSSTPATSSRRAAPRSVDDDCDIAEFGPRLLEQAVALLPQALDRVAAGDPGRPAAGGGRDLGRPLRGRRLRAHRLVAAGAPDPRPGARMASDVRASRSCALRSRSSTARRSWCCRRG